MADVSNSELPVSGYVVMAVPEDGLFVNKSGQLSDRRGQVIMAPKIRVHRTAESAERHKEKSVWRWPRSKFLILPVEVEEINRGAEEKYAAKRTNS